MRRAPQLVAAVAVVALALGGLAAYAMSRSAEPKRTEPTVAGFRAVTAPERAGIKDEIAMGVVGAGARRVYVLRREAATGPQPLVIFFHGYGTATVAGQEPWLSHLTKRATVAWPVYAKPPFDGERGADEMFPSAADGLRKALRRLRARHLVSDGAPIVAGYSLGGALAADYAAAAPRFGLPRPSALYAVFPGRGLCGGRVRLPPQPGEIGSRTRILTLASTHDLLAGTCEARAIVADAERVPDSMKTLDLVRDFELGDHFAPTRSGPQERAEFWKPLDRLLSAAPQAHDTG